MRGKISRPEDAFTGRFDDHHAFLLAKMLARVDGIDADISDLDAKDRRTLRPFR
jgi:transposase